MRISYFLWNCPYIDMANGNYHNYKINSLFIMIKDYMIYSFNQMKVNIINYGHVIKRNCTKRSI